jgi:hypothetical protein
MADSAEASGVKWSVGAGLGDVNGPASASDNRIARFDGTTGKLIQNSTVTVDDFGNTTGLGSLNLKRTSTGVNYLTANDYYVGVINTDVPRTITLSSADTQNGRTIIVKDETGGAGTNNITIDTQGAELIDGLATIVISAGYGVARLYSNGINWFTF